MARKAQAAAPAQSSIPKGWTIPGLRISNPKDGHESGMVVTLTEDEAEPVLAVIRKVVEARR